MFEQAICSAEIEKAAGDQGIPFEGMTVLLKDQVAEFFEVATRIFVSTTPTDLRKCLDGLGAMTQSAENLVIGRLWIVVDGEAPREGHIQVAKDRKRRRSPNALVRRTCCVDRRFGSLSFEEEKRASTHYKACIVFTSFHQRNP
jgi:hypothetical protein